MAKQDEKQLRKMAHDLERAQAPDLLKAYTDEVEDSVVKHFERLDELSKSNAGTARLIADTMSKTLAVIPKNDRIKFVYTVVAGTVAIVIAYLKLHH